MKYIIQLIYCLSIAAFGEVYQCSIYELDCPKLPKGEIAYINGMNQRPWKMLRCIETLSTYSGGYKVYGVYNPSKGLMKGLTGCFLELYSFCLSAPVKKLHEKWSQFFAQATSDEIYLQFCHSQGAIQVRNALLYFSPQLRKRIMVVAVAPAAYIPDEICYRAFHYISSKDIVPKLDRIGRKRCQESVFILSPQRSTFWIDHHFLSPTYRDAIQFHLKEYLQKTCW